MNLSDLSVNAPLTIDYRTRIFRNIRDVSIIHAGSRPYYISQAVPPTTFLLSAVAAQGEDPSIISLRMYLASLQATTTLNLRTEGIGVYEVTDSSRAHIMHARTESSLDRITAETPVFVEYEKVALKNGVIGAARNIIIRNDAAN
jgi:hypothetical protein